MIDGYQAVWLGLVQGLTEFLPVSSSGHLVLGQRILGINQPELLFNIAVHIGTLAAVLAVFRADILTMIQGLWAKSQRGRQGRRLILLVVAGSVPTALMGFLAKDYFESLFASVTAVGVALIITACALWLTRYAHKGSRGLQDTGLMRAFAIGVAQGLAITPGISRSGATIACGLFLGLDRKLAARYSFLLSIPAICGALLLELKDLAGTPAPDMNPLLIGAAAAAASGYAALKILIKVVDNGKLHWFAPYCLFVGGAALLSTI